MISAIYIFHFFRHIKQKCFKPNNKIKKFMPQLVFEPKTYIKNVIPYYLKKTK